MHLGGLTERVEDIFLFKVDVVVLIPAQVAKKVIVEPRRQGEAKEVRVCSATKQTTRRPFCLEIQADQVGEQDLSNFKIALLVFAPASKPPLSPFFHAISSTVTLPSSCSMKGRPFNTMSVQIREFARIALVDIRSLSNVIKPRLPLPCSSRKYPPFLPSNIPPTCPLIR